MTTLFLPFRFARRELRAGTHGFRLFIACLILGVAAIAGIGSISAAAISGIAANAKAILGGDMSKFVHPLIHARLQAKVAQLGG